MEQKSKFVSNREYMANGLSADLEDYVKGSRIKSGYCNLDLFRPIMPHLMHIKLYFLQIDIFIAA